MFSKKFAVKEAG